MSKERHSAGRRDRILGMDQAITRRDFLNASLLGAGAMLVSAPSPLNQIAQQQTWYGFGGVGDYEMSHGNTEEVLRVAHEIRDGTYDQRSADTVETGELFDLVIIGGGMSGLSAAYYFKKSCQPGQTCLILENHPVFGGASKRNEFLVDGFELTGPQAANEFDIPLAGEEGHELYSELGVPQKFEYQTMPEGLRQLQFDRTNYGFHLWVDEAPSFGYFFDQAIHGVRPTWIRDIWGQKLKGTPFSDRAKRDLLDWKFGQSTQNPGTNWQHWLDTMTYKGYLEGPLGLGPEVARYVDPILAAAIGLGSDGTSAYGAYELGMPGFRGLSDNSPYPSQLERIAPSTWHSFPGGNDGFARHFVKALIPAAISGDPTFENILNGRLDFRVMDDPGQSVRIRLDSTAVRVEHEGSPEQAGQVQVTYVKAGKTYRLRARAVVLASGGFMNRLVVRDLPSEYRQAYDSFLHSPMLVVNVALTNWRFLYKLGITACRWFDGFGFSCNIRRPMLVGNRRPPLDPSKPIVLTFYVPFYYPGHSPSEQGSMGRLELLAKSYRDYERLIREQMTRLFGQAGFDPKSDIAGIILNRWGHAYVNPQPGFYFGKDERPAARDVVRQRFGRICFGHSELVGHQYWLGAFRESRRACRQAIEVL